VKTATEPLPFFEVTADEVWSTRRLLLVSCVFPPDPGVGALRWQKLARFAAGRGWGLDVLMFYPSGLRSRDEGRLAELPPGTRIYAVPRPEQLSRSLLAAWRGVRWMMRPRATPARTLGGPPTTTNGSRLETIRVRYLTHVDFLAIDRFARQASRIAERILRVPGVHRAVISSGPPHMAHEAARLIAERAKIPFVMDMRDPWCSLDVAPEFAHRSNWLRRTERYERQCVERARLVVANTDAAASALRERYAELSHRFVTVMNGADDDVLPAPTRTDRFRIAFAGTLYVGRDPRRLFDAVGRVVRELSLSPADLDVAFMGSEEYGGISVTRLAEEFGIADYFTFQPAGSRRAALELLSSAAMLVNLPQDVRLAIPAKIFEYVRFEAWLLALTESGTATEVLLRGSGADLVEPDDVEGIATVIRRRFEAYRRGERPRALNADGRFDRARQADILFDALEREVG
jgi:hypothetical protein